MSVVTSKFRSRWAVAVLAPVLALAGVTLIGSPTEAVPPVCVTTAAPQIQASATVPQGGEFELRGRGMYPCAYVEVYLGARNSKYLDYALTDNSGRFDGWFSVPSSTPLGTQVITVYDYDGATYTTTIKIVRGGSTIY